MYVRRLPAAPGGTQPWSRHPRQHRARASSEIRMIRADSIGYVEQSRCFFRDVMLRVAPGECVAIVGSRATARTMLWRVLAILVPPTWGRIEIAGINGATDPFEARRR